MKGLRFITAYSNKKIPMCSHFNLRHHSGTMQRGKQWYHFPFDPTALFCFTTVIQIYKVEQVKFIGFCFASCRNAGLQSAISNKLNY